MPANGAYVVLLWRAAATPDALMALSPTTVATYLTAIAGGTAAVIPGGWNVAAGSGGAALRTVSVPVDGRMPRGTSIDVDLSAVPAGQHVLFLAFVGSTADDLPLSLPAINPLTSITDLVRSWPYAAARVVMVIDRPV